MGRSHRWVRGLRWAATCSRPAHIPRSRPRGTKADGLRFEKNVAKALPDATYGLWFEFGDSEGHAFCAPDLVLRSSWGTFIIEIKRTEVPEARTQLSELYIPVVSLALGGPPAMGIIVAKNLAQDSLKRCDAVTDTLAHAMQLALGGKIPVLHWLGRTASALRPLKWPAVA